MGCTRTSRPCPERAGCAGRSSHYMLFSNCACDDSVTSHDDSQRVQKKRATGCELAPTPSPDESRTERCRLLRDPKPCYSVRMSATLSVTLRDIALILALMLSGCAAPTATPRTITSTPDFTATPPPTPTPAQALNPDALWIASDAPSRQVIVASPDGDVTSISLPLNEGQTASEMAASPDGHYLAYIVWNSDIEQYGIAMWNLAEPFARLIVQPLPGYGIVSLMFSADSETLLYVQMDSP